MREDYAYSDRSAVNEVGLDNLGIFFTKGHTNQPEPSPKTNYKLLKFNHRSGGLTGFCGFLEPDLFQSNMLPPLSYQD
jgi:hypothetical protein